MADESKPVVGTVVSSSLTPGIKTTEFWVGAIGSPLLGLVMMFLSVKTGDPDLAGALKEAAISLLSFGPVGYVIARGLRKFGVGESRPPVVIVPPPTDANEAAKKIGSL